MKRGRWRHVLGGGSRSAVATASTTVATVPSSRPTTTAAAEADITSAAATVAVVAVAVAAIGAVATAAFTSAEAQEQQRCSSDLTRKNVKFYSRALKVINFVQSGGNIIRVCVREEHWEPSPRTGLGWIVAAGSSSLTGFRCGCVVVCAFVCVCMG